MQEKLSKINKEFATPTIKLADLEMGTYIILKSMVIKTKYGECGKLEILHNNQSKEVFINKKFNDIILDEEFKNAVDEGKAVLKIIGKTPKVLYNLNTL